MPLHVDWSVTVNGRPATARMNPYIEEIECTAKAGGSADSATLTFDDTDGQVILPPKNSPITISILGRLVFKGFTEAPRSTGGRGDGSRLEVPCKGFDKSGKIKQKQHKHKDDATLKDFLEETAKSAGLGGIKIDPELAKIKRKYWNTGGRNFLQLGQHLADTLGGTFVVRGDQAVLAKRGQGKTPGGQTVPTIYATKGVNVESWSLSPFEPRQKFSKARLRFYDRKAAKWKKKDVEIGPGPGAAEVFDLPGDAVTDESRADQHGQGHKSDSDREGGSGTVLLDIEVLAEPEGTCIVEIRKGVDGPYRIEARTHHVTRSGATTSCEVKQPQGSAGTDSRGKGAGK